MYKKYLTAILSLSAAFTLVACSSDGGSEEADRGLQDGSYRIEETNFGDTGWKESLDITVADGEISEATWTSVDEEGNNKLDDEEYQETMSAASGVGPQDFIPALEDALVEVQDPAEVEVVTGATGTSDKFKDYSQQVVDAASEGNTETIVVDN